MKFRKKPVVIEATQWFKHGDDPDVKDFSWLLVVGSKNEICPHCKAIITAHGQIDTLEGSQHIVCPGDWIITGVKGERYACKPDIFEQTYEPV